MMITTKFDVGDEVRLGPHNGKVGRIVIGQAITYIVMYWNNEGQAHEYTAFDFELELIKAVSPQD